MHIFAKHMSDSPCFIPSLTITLTTLTPNPNTWLFAPDFAGVVRPDRLLLDDRRSVGHGGILRVPHLDIRGGAGG